MLADLFHAPGRDDRRAHPGLVRGDHARRAVPEVEVARAPRGRRQPRRTSPNLVFGGDVHVVWEKFCRYFDVEPRIVPLQPRASTRSGPRTSRRTSTRTRSASPPCSARRSPGTWTTSSASTTCSCDSRTSAGLDVPLHVDGASGGFVWPFLYPDSPWDFRLEQVRSINVSGHKFGLVYPGIGWLIFREKSRPGRGPRLLRELPRQDRRDVHAELLDRRRRWCSRSTTTSSATAATATPTSCSNMQENARALADEAARRAAASS